MTKFHTGANIELVLTCVNACHALREENNAELLDDAMKALTSVAVGPSVSRDLRAIHKNAVDLATEFRKGLPAHTERSLVALETELQKWGTTDRSILPIRQCESIGQEL